MEAMSLVARLRRSFESFHGLPAIERGGTQLTYGELQARARVLARQLAARAGSPGAAVAVLVEDRIEVVVALLACLEAGTVFCAIDPRLPEKRLAEMLTIAAPGLFLVEPPHAGLARRLVPGAEQLSPGAAADPAPQELPATWDEEAACYLCFTSGSTGTPKAIAGNRRGLNHFLDWEIQALHLGQGARVSQLMTPSFDAFLRDILAPLCVGGTLCIPEEADIVMDAPRLVRFLHEQQVDLVHCVPSVFRSLLGEPLTASTFPRLRHIVMAGEPLLAADVGRWYDVFGERVQLVNLYGTSETTMAKFSYFVSPADRGRQVIPAGRPMEGVSALLLDARGRPVAAGLVGEIYIRTPFRLLGYYRQPELTAEVFVPDPVQKDSGALLHRTGDFGRLSASGELEVLGRRDQQVKVRGVRVELAEIENLLRRHEAVRDAIVMAREDSLGNNFLCVYVVLARELSVGVLREHLAELLPATHLPSSFVVMESFPRTVSGKVDRKALPAPAQALRRRQAGFVAPRTPLEEVLAGIWARILGLDRIGVRDHFFELGGHSLLATQVVAEVRRSLQVELPLRDFLDSPTLAGMAERISQLQRSSQGRGGPPLRVLPRPERLPLSFAQRRLWFLDQLEPDSPVYNVYGGLRVSGPLELPALERALFTLVERHEALRTTIAVFEGEPFQQVRPVPDFRLELSEVSGPSLPRREQEALRLAAAEAERPFALSRGPLFRVRAIRLDAEEWMVFLTLHHLVFDIWSLDVLYRELTALYEAFCEGRPSPLQPLSVQYADYTLWQRELLRGERLEALLAYWRKRLAGAAPLLALPTDRARPLMQSHRGAELAFSVPPSTVSALKQLGVREGATLFMTLLAAFKVLLLRFSGQEDMVVGAPIANRTVAELAELIGFFVNTLVLRTDLSGDPPFTEVLARVRETALEAYSHQDLPFEQLVEALQPSRSLGQSPLFQVLFVLQNAVQRSPRLGELRVRPFMLPSTTAKFDLTVTFEETSEGLSGLLEYNTDLWEEETMQSLVRAFQVLLAGVASAPQQRISQLPLLTAEEERLRLQALPALPPPAAEAVQVLFERQAARQPEAPALVFEGGSLTYGELEAWANRLAHELRGRGVAPESRIGLCVGRSPGMVAALLAVLKAGAACVPLDPELPAERLGAIMADAQVRLVLTQSHLAEGLSAHGVPLLVLEREPRSGGEPGEARASACAASSGALAFVLYTSGSTGRPRGVMLEHGSLVRFLETAGHLSTWAPGDRVLQFASIGFDVSLEEILGSLTRGATLVLRAGAMMGSAAAFLAGCDELRVSVLALPTAFWHELVSELATHGLQLPSSLRLVIIGGEQALAERVGTWCSRVGQRVRLLNLYGPTEATISVTGRDLSDLGPGPRAWPVPIGRAFPGVRALVLDARLRPVPDGFPGELYLGGEYLTRGYLGDPALTAERFVPDPSGAAPGSRLLRTGDLARRRADGELTLSGRRDRQVKVRGVRVELAEVEAALSACPQLQAAAVVAREEAPGEVRLIAYVVLRRGLALSSAELRAAVARSLPPAMVPSSFVSLDALPLTPSGKVSHAALPAPAAVATPSEVPTAAAAGLIEELISQVFADALGVSRVQPGDDFFSLGGHSLSAIRLLSRLRGALGLELPLRQLFEAPSPAGLALRCAEALRGSAASPPLTRLAARGEGPLSLAQQRVWQAEQVLPGAVGHTVLAYRLVGSVDCGALATSLRALVRRHEVLRTALTLRDGAPLQVVSTEGEASIEEVDLRAEPESSRPALVQRHLSLEARHPLELERGRLAHLTLLRLGDDEHLLVVKVHPIALDGRSAELLLGELGLLYECALLGRTAELPELPVQYLDYALWQRQWLQSEEGQALRSAWRRRLAGPLNRLELPAARPGTGRGYRLARRSLTLPNALWQALLSSSRREDSTPFLSCLSALVALLQRLTGAGDIRIGTLSANRERPGLEGLLGLLANTLVVRADASGDPSLRELRQRVRDRVIEASALQALPFEELLATLAQEPGFDPEALLQVMFLFNDASRPALRLHGCQASPAQPPHTGGVAEAHLSVMRCELYLHVCTGPEDTLLVMGYDASRFDERTIAWLLESYTRLLEHVTSEPALRLSEVPGAGGPARS